MTHLRLSAATAALLALTSPTVVHAADALRGLQEGSGIERNLVDATGVGRAGDSILDARVFPEASDTGKGEATVAIAEINAATDGGRATFKIAHANQSGSIEFANKGDEIDAIEHWRSTTHSWSLIVSAPFDKSGSATDILGSGTLPGDFQATLGFSGFSTDVTIDTSGQNDPLVEAEGICEQVWKKKLGDKINTIAPDKLKDYLQKHCLVPKPEELTATYLDKQHQYRAASIEGGSWLWGAEASIGYNKFDYYDPATAAKLNSTHVPWSLKGYVGWVPSADAFLILASIDYEDVAKAGKNGTLCPAPTPLPAVLTCVTGAIGAPTASHDFLGSLELRREVSLGAPFTTFGLTDLGVDAKFTYDTKSDVYSFDLPLSFAMDDKKNLIGGVRVGWQSDNHNVFAGIFVSSAFSLFPG